MGGNSKTPGRATTPEICVCVCRSTYQGSKDIGQVGQYGNHRILSIFGKYEGGTTRMEFYQVQEIEIEIYKEQARNRPEQMSKNQAGMDQK